MRWWPAEAIEPGALRDTLRGALEAVERGDARDQKRGRRKQLFLLALGAGEAPSHLLKVNRYAGWPSLRRRLGGSKSRLELARASAVAARGIPTPLPLAAGERREGMRLRSCYLLIPYLEGAEDLRAVARRPAERRALAAPFGRFARRVHDAGVDQDDFQPNNFLRGAGGPEDLWLIDCERLRLRRGPLSPRERARLLAKLERELPAASLAERARFLRAYAGGGRGAWRPLWREVEAAARRLARHDAARLERVVARPGRRFEPFEAAGWSGIRSAAGSADGLAEALHGEFGAALRRARPGDLVGGPDHFAFALGEADARAPAAALARALVLAKRGLAPAPTALLRGPGRALVVFRGALPLRLGALAPEARRALRPALLRLLERLAAVGRAAELRADHIGLAPEGAPLALQLLAAPSFEPGAPPPGGRAARRALAARLLDLGD